ncbi:MAG: hypothetical protein HRT53_11160 [Colwellia sp.]|nr:hypothetical protein [Colwellia sp.]
MQFFEITFGILTTLFLVKLLIGPSLRLPKPSYFILAGLILIILVGALEGLRWQMILAYTSFGFLALASLKKSKTPRLMKIFATVGVGTFLVLSFFLSSQLPVINLAAPNGPHAVGTFSYSMLDKSRIEHYAPEQKRELYIQVWYPTDKKNAKNFPVRTLWQEMYSGEFDLFSFFSSHLKYVDTHAHINSPIVKGENFPVLLFSHGLFLVAEQNTILMEHLASHGYVILSIGRPYQSAKVNLTHAGSITASSRLPDDAGLTKEMKSKGEQTFYEISEQNLKAINELMVDFSSATSEHNKRVIVTNALASEKIQKIEPKLTTDSLYELLAFLHYNNRSVDTWVKDIQFIADTIVHVEAPINDFLTSLNLNGFGVFGMSRGGAASAEFCKIDSRCRAGGNMDGFQYGEHWLASINAPFLMLSSVENAGMNDFAYLPAEEQFMDYVIKGTMHADFFDFVSIMPLIHYLEMGDQVDAKRINEIINTVQLRFFDHYLKGKQNLSGITTEVPELLIREHGIRGK